MDSATLAAPIAPTDGATMVPPTDGATMVPPPAPIAPTDGATMAAPSMAGVGPPRMPSIGAPPSMPGAGPPSMPSIGGPPPISGFAGPPPMPPARYELGGEIARGGMGRVIDATDTVLGRTVALKEVLSLDADVLRRFARETRITARLEHPAIVPVHDAGTMSGGAPFYVMRKISGRPLERLVATADTLNQRLVLIPHIVAACAAIAHAHERGVVHRDIKPSNILVGELGETIVIDWGLAKLIGETDEVTEATRPLRGGAPLVSGALMPSANRDDADTDVIKTRAGIVYGTPGFMSPEQLRGAPVTERCDVYALGATLYHLLSRKPPHHAKTADEMMRAAVREPPTPIGELVAGVPAELSTIIDKALAHDPVKRYQDARALAEDLQRFLSGQLVASHHYSRRERLVRFVRKHRVPVGIAAAATLVLLVIGTLAVTRVVRERDRADEQRVLALEGQQRAERAADELTLAQARVEVERNPTRAVAMLKRLAQTRWRDVRSIAAAARANGVAFGLPAAKRTATLELSPDGVHALAAGADGEVRIYDLVARTARSIPHRLGPGVRARFADDARQVALWRDRTLVITDAAGRAVRTLQAPGPIRDLRFAGAIAYWGDPGGALWQLDPSAAAPKQVPLPELLGEPPDPAADEFLLSPSPDGRYVALRGRDHLLIHDRTVPDGPPIEVTRGSVKDFDWSGDSQNFGALFDQDAILVAVDEGAYIRRRRVVGNRDGIAFGNGKLYTIGPLGVAMVAREEDESGPRYQKLLGDPVGVREARGNSIIAASHGSIAVLSGLGDRALLAPAGFIQHLEASPRSPYIVAAIEGQLVVWNLDDIEPRRIADETPALMSFVGANQAIVAFADSGAQWIDFATGKLAPLGPWQLLAVAASPSGKLACALDIGHRARLIAPGREPVLIDGEFDVAGFATETALVLGNGATGAAHLYDVQSGALTPLIANHGKLLDLAWNRATPAWIAAAFADGTLWRRSLATGATTTAPARVVLTTHLQLARDGTLLFADDRAVRAWRPDGKLDKLVEFEAPIQALGLAGPDHLFVALHAASGGPNSVAGLDRATYLVTLAAPQAPASLDILAPSKLSARNDLSASMAADAGAIVLANNGGIEVIDTIAKHRWTLATPPPPTSLGVQSTVSYAGPQISNDGTRVIARFANALVTWSIAVPVDSAATRAWIERLTNATMDDPSSGRLSWR